MMAPLTYGSVCSGIEAATVAWHPLGWRPSFFSEIDAFPRAVLAHHYPTVPCHGDFTTIEASQYDPIELLVGGTPCQSFSIAGLRGGLSDDRGNLALEYLRLAQRLRPRWLVWENVPGVLSSFSCPEPPRDLAEGEEWQAVETSDFGSFLSGLVELGYGFAYRVLDAQHFGVPQRRRRVFVVGYLGDWRPAAAVLFERHSLQGHSAPRRQARESAPAGTAFGLIGNGEYAQRPASLRAKGGDCGGGSEHLIAATLDAASGRSRGAGTPIGCLALGGNNTSGAIDVACALNACGTASGRMDFERETFVTHALTANGFDASEDGTGRGTPLVPCYPINTQIATRHKAMGRGTGFGISDDGEPSFTLQSAHSHAVGYGPSVRRLTPPECERLQGFPDDYTAVPYRGKIAADGPRYKALGNSMNTDVMAWIGHRIDMVRACLSSPSPVGE